jgi:hypothetical protein
MLYISLGGRYYKMLDKSGIKFNNEAWERVNKGGKDVNFNA